MKNIYLKVAECHKALAEAYQALADSYCINAESASTNEVPWKEKTSEPKSEPIVDITAVRKVLAEKTQSGKSEGVKALLLKYGANKLSAIASENYTSLLQEAEEL